ncbi:MAG TPA: M20 family peptidase [Saprospiraceae bacterium]|nr:M20 family peptidase [Saprospiraceae bacterium]
MRRLIRRIKRLSITALVIIIGIMGIKTIAFTSRQVNIASVEALPVEDGVADRLAGAIQFPTLSTSTTVDTAALLGFGAFLQQQFPMVDSLLERRVINRLSYVYKWPGLNPKLPSILLMAHQDVVPVEESAGSEWAFPPFSGEIAEGFIWGRGALDDKSSLLAILEAVERLLKEGYAPQRTIYLAFGHDEEVGGLNGAQQIAAYFKREGIQFEYVLDEGTMVLEKPLAGLNQPLAMIGIAEKGYVTLSVSVQLEEAGHSSMPPSQTAIGILSQALARLQDNPFPAHINGATDLFFDYVGPEMTPLFKVLFANRWLTGGLIKQQLSSDPAANAIIRTTSAPTIISGGIKENVLPATATARVNFRILPGDNIESVLAYVRKVIQDQRVSVEVWKKDEAMNPSSVSGVNTFGFEAIQRTTQEIFPEAIVAPALMIGATDSRHYTEVAANIYRFMPVQLTHNDLSRYHGINECISLDNYKRMIRFYRQLILNSCK